MFDQEDAWKTFRELLEKNVVDSSRVRDAFSSFGNAAGTSMSAPTHTQIYKRGGAVRPAWSATDKQRNWLRQVTHELKSVPADQLAIIDELITRDDFTGAQMSQLVQEYWDNDRDGKKYPNKK